MLIHAVAIHRTCVDRQPDQRAVATTHTLQFAVDMLAIDPCTRDRMLVARNRHFPRINRAPRRVHGSATGKLIARESEYALGTFIPRDDAPFAVLHDHPFGQRLNDGAVARFAFGEFALHALLLGDVVQDRRDRPHAAVRAVVGEHRLQHWPLVAIHVAQRRFALPGAMFDRVRNARVMQLARGP